MEAIMQGTLSRVHTATEPELSYGDNGTAKLSFKVLADKWAKSGNKTISYRVTMWGQRAEFFGKLMQHHTSKSGKPGVGLSVSLFFNVVLEPYAWTPKDGNGVNTQIEMTVYDMIIHTQLPESAYADVQGRQGQQQQKRPSSGKFANTGSKDWNNEDRDDIPF